MTLPLLAIVFAVLAAHAEAATPADAAAAAAAAAPPVVSTSWALWLLRFLLVSVLPLWLVYHLYVYPYFLHPLRNAPGPRSPWIYGTHAHVYTRERRMNDVLKEIVGNGLLTAETGDQHKRQRALIGPSFRIKHIAAMVPTFVRTGREFVASLSSRLAAAPVTESGHATLDIDVYKEASKVTLDIIGRAGFAYDFHAVASGDAVDGGGGGVGEGDILRNLVPGGRSVPTPAKAKYDRARALTRSIVKEILQSGYHRVDAGSDGKDLLSILIRANNESEERISQDELEGQILTFVGAGHETTSTSLTWTLLLLAQHRDVQTRLHAAITAALTSGAPLASNPDDPDLLTYDLIHAIPLLDAVCKESLRLYPPVPVNSRTAQCDDVIDGFIVPRGTAVFTPAVVLHRLPALWGQDAEAFVPERWLPGGGAGAGGGSGGAKEEAAEDPAEAVPAGAAVPKAFGAFMPFSLGPRNCIGARFATTELKVLVALLLLEFEFAEVPEFTFKKKLTLTWKPHPRLLLRVSRREPPRGSV
ncbi:cytochrome P450 [Zopfochytrium polystomum]|nr:cytochrome P450 [Zopfochytrium polystomum]